MTSALPVLYQRWMEELLSAPPPVESRSTCHDCPMISDDPRRNASGTQFNPQTKCCTYWPELPNFLVGFILQDNNLDFHSATRDMTFTPLGATPPASFFERYKSQKTFGSDAALLCPFYQPNQEGNCGIWKYRNARCATWFCRFTHGSASVIFWKYMDQLLTQVERSVLRWCILQLDFSSHALQLIFPPPRSGMRIAPEMWGKWLNREREFFNECAALTGALTWKDVAQIGGMDLEVPARLLQDAHRNLLEPALPSRVKMNRWKKHVPVDEDKIRIWTYSQYDPVEVQRDVVDVLPYFENCSTQEALDRIHNEKGLRLNPEYIKWLTNFGVLIGA